MPITTLPRTIVKAGLQGLRLPLTAIERVTGKADSTTWPPALAYESFEAGAKKILGSLLRDEDLVREGRLQRAKLAELAEAERLQAKAEQHRMAADAELRQRQESAEEARARVEQQAEAREQRLAREKAEKERQVREQARQREETAERAGEVREKAVSIQERSARKTRIGEESEALAQRGSALDAAREAEALQEALEAKKAERKRG